MVCPTYGAIKRSLSLQPRNSLTDRSHCWAHGPYRASRVPASVQILKMWSIPVASKASPLADLQWMRVSGWSGSGDFASEFEVAPVSESREPLGGGVSSESEAVKYAVCEISIGFSQNASFAAGAKSKDRTGKDAAGADVTTVGFDSERAERKAMDVCPCSGGFQRAARSSKGSVAASAGEYIQPMTKHKRPNKTFSFNTHPADHREKSHATIVAKLLSNHGQDI